MLAKGGSGTVTTEAYNNIPDDVLVEKIRTAADFYASLRTLSWRLPLRTNEEGRPFTQEGAVSFLEALMDDSVAAQESHPRHDDWIDRRGKIEDLVTSAFRKHASPEFTPQMIEVLSPEDSLIDLADFQAALTRHLRPQPVTDHHDIEARIADLAQNEIDDFVDIHAAGLRADLIEPLTWILPGMIPEAGTVSLAGTSNVGKTRWLAALVMALAMGDTARMGLPQATQAVSSLWIANEERVDDIRRRVKAASLQHDDTESLHILVRGKDTGMLRLVTINENGMPEIDEENVARVVAQARRLQAKLIIFDPYVTLSDAIDENSAVSAAMLTKAFLLISNLTGAAILHAHHTPKDRAKDTDWYRGDGGGWRGSGAIYSALDCAFTLSHWMPKNTEQRRLWRQGYLDEKLSLSTPE